MKECLLICLIVFMTSLSACSSAAQYEKADNENVNKTEADSSTGSDSFMPNNDPAVDEKSIDITEHEKEDLISKAVNAAGAEHEDVLRSEVKDFDGDGNDEAFVLIANETSGAKDDCTARLWFVSADSCEEIFQYQGFLDTGLEMLEVYDVNDRTFAVLNEIFSSNIFSRLFYVVGGKCEESAVSGIGQFLKPDYTDDYCISVGCYDAMYEYEEGKKDEGFYLGHTWKVYYFYYDKETSDFKEYVAIPATSEELSLACGFDLAEEIRSAGYQVDGIIRRDNGIFNINYSKVEDNGLGMTDIIYSNATYNEKSQKFLDVRDGEKNTWQNSDFSGIYKESALDENR